MADFKEKGVHLRIESPRLTGHGAHIFLNDIDITNACQDIRIDMPLCGPQRATIQVLVRKLDLEGTVLTELLPSEPSDEPMRDEPCAS